MMTRPQIPQERDIHVLKYFSTYISISKEKIIYMSEPTLTFCPLASRLHNDFFSSGPMDKESIKEAIRQTIESKIKDDGFFTARRQLEREDILVPFGASEMMMFALKNKAIDAAVVVCEGAGTVITDQPRVVQGIGGRMNSLLLTSPIQGIMEKLEKLGCRLISQDGRIDQVSGVKEAVKMGYRCIAVTVSGRGVDDSKRLRLLEKESGARIVVLAVCTTGIDEGKIRTIGDHADLVWSCASSRVSEEVGPRAILQFSCLRPVFVLTKNGVAFVSSCADRRDMIRNLDDGKQFLVSHKPQGECVTFGSCREFLRPQRLPVNSEEA